MIFDLGGGRRGAAPRRRRGSGGDSSRVALHMDGRRRQAQRETRTTPQNHLGLSLVAAFPTSFLGSFGRFDLPRRLRGAVGG